MGLDSALRMGYTVECEYGRKRTLVSTVWASLVSAATRNKNLSQVQKPVLGQAAKEETSSGES